MNTTGQSLHIESLISDSVKREKKADVIQKLYLLCIEEFSEQDFDTLIQLIEESVLSWIRKQLWIAGCYSEDEENTILQDARLAVWNAVQSVAREREIIESYYGLGDSEELTLTEIGKKYNLSSERVRQIKLNSIRKLRSAIMMDDNMEELRG